MKTFYTLVPTATKKKRREQYSDPWNTEQEQGLSYHVLHSSSNQFCMLINRGITTKLKKLNRGIILKGSS